ncbi:porin [uncultured Maricaulis sp.]|uniref:OprO/OprP family phosphate-selective porin n=1 Tax=uncultured Maricaulis sp. TaxID=174710 RepID=UPI0030D8B2BC|tara:strand:+ start:214588 stop:215790 length:1203 start_codon:yes stop_codon:yes gene_type:complete
MFKRYLTSAALVALASAAGLSAAHADDASGWNFDGVPSWSNAATGDSFTFRGRIYLDAANIDFDRAGVTTTFNDSEIRTGRLGITGQFAHVGYVAEFDLINNQVRAKDVALTFHATGFDVLVGNMKTPNSLEEQTSSRYITFMERGTGTELFGLDRRVGVAIAHHGDNYTFKAGAYGGVTGDLSQSFSTDDSSAFAARITYLPVHTDNLLVHLGASVRQMDYGNAGTRVRARPRTHSTDRIVTADFRPGRPLGEADSSTLIGLEAAAISGPFHAHAEYMTMELNGPTGNPRINSAFLNLGYFLTGETRSYSTSGGSFSRTHPTTPVSEGGMGAIELAARYDYSDLNDVAAGELTTWTLGANWYVEDHFRVMANYVTGELAVPGGPNTSVSGPQVRVQWDF